MLKKSTKQAVFLGFVGFSSFSLGFSPGLFAEVPISVGQKDLLSKAKKQKKDKKRSAPSSEDAPAVTLRGAAAFNAYTGSQNAKRNFVWAAGNPAAVPTVGDVRTSSRHFALDDTKLEFQVFKPIESIKDTAWRFNLAFSGDKGGTKFNKIVKQAYITLLSPYATVHLGNYAGVEDTMALSGGSVLGNIGFESTGIYNFAAATTGVHKGIDLVGDTGESTKITLLSPRWRGLMLGVSYTPSTSQFGAGDLNKFDGRGYGSYTTENLAAGLSYVGFLQPDLKLSLSLTGVLGQSQPESRNFSPGQSLQRRSIRSVALGGVLSYKAFSFGAEYAHCGKSAQFSTDRLGVNPNFGGLMPLNYTASQAQAPRWFDVGVSYLYKQTKFALGYLQSWRKTGFGNTARGHLYNVSMTYQRQPGLDFYVEAFRVNMKNDAALYEGKLVAQALPTTEKAPAAVLNQKANVFVLGMKVSF